MLIGLTASKRTCVNIALTAYHDDNNAPLAEGQHPLTVALGKQVRDNDHCLLLSLLLFLELGTVLKGLADVHCSLVQIEDEVCLTENPIEVRISIARNQ